MKLFPKWERKISLPSVLNPHGSDETNNCHRRCTVLKNVLNPHGSDETKGGMAYGKDTKIVLNPHGSDETSPKNYRPLLLTRCS